MNKCIICNKNREEHNEKLDCPEYTIYGYYTGTDPRKFQPDKESCSEEEIQNWLKCCELWNDLESKGVDPTKSLKPTSIGIGTYTAESGTKYTEVLHWLHSEPTSGNWKFDVPFNNVIVNNIRLASVWQTNENLDEHISNGLLMAASKEMFYAITNLLMNIKKNSDDDFTVNKDAIRELENAFCKAINEPLNVDPLTKYL